MHVNVQEVYANSPCNVLAGFSMHETTHADDVYILCHCADLAFPECPSGLTVHLEASLIPL